MALHAKHYWTGSSYASPQLVKLLGKQLVKTERKRIDMICSTIQKTERCDIRISILDKFEMTPTISKVDEGVLLWIPNPKYAEKNLTSTPT